MSAEKAIQTASKLYEARRASKLILGDRWRRQGFVWIGLSRRPADQGHPGRDGAGNVARQQRADQCRAWACVVLEPVAYVAPFHITPQ